MISPSPVVGNRYEIKTFRMGEPRPNLVVEVINADQFLLVVRTESGREFPLPKSDLVRQATSWKGTVA